MNAVLAFLTALVSAIAGFFTWSRQSRERKAGRDALEREILERRLDDLEQKKKIKRVLRARPDLAERVRKRAKTPQR